jgi:hypothetical protein
MRRIKPLAFILACALSFSYLTARADNNGNGNGHGYGRDKDKHEHKEGKKVPIDGGIGLLLVAGVALGAKRVFQKNQKNTATT